MTIIADRAQETVQPECLGNSKEDSTAERRAEQILVVVVCYKCALSESETVKGLSEAFASRAELARELSVLIWDNSPCAQNGKTSFHSIYRHSGRNLGVSGAYNQALKLAVELGCPWLLLLDQDTAISSSFLLTMLEYSHKLEDSKAIGAVAPFVTDEGRPVSPGLVLFHKIRILRPPFEGIHPGEVYAVNSGTLMRVEALRKVGGFNEDFWLDMADIVVFHAFHEIGIHLYIAGGLTLQHEISLADYNRSMTPGRYSNFISAEGAYWDLYRGAAANRVQTLRLFARAVRQYFRFADKTYSRVTFTCFLERTFYSKAKRLELWRKRSAMRDLPGVLHSRAQAL